MLPMIKLAVAILTVLVGAYALFWPKAALDFTGLAAPTGRGISEVRAVLGGLFIGLGAAVLYMNRPEAYVILGVTYLAIAAARMVSIVVDQAAVSSNWISLVTEIIFGVLLIL